MNILFWVVVCLCCVSAFPAVAGRLFPLAVFDGGWSQGLESRVFTDMGGGQYLTECRATLRGDRLFVELPNTDKEHFFSISFAITGSGFEPAVVLPGGEAGFTAGTIKSCELVLSKAHYAMGEMLKGHLSFSFLASRENGFSTDGVEEDEPVRPAAFMAHGPFAAVVRPPGFDRTADANVAGYSYDTALYELGEPADEGELLLDAQGAYSRTDLCLVGTQALEGLPAAARPGLAFVREEFLARGRVANGQAVRELTWVSYLPSGELECLTVWFSVAKGRGAKGLGFKRW
ncbi:hypothetical protein LJC46_01265 [Desulfovibrio sp. OttesenSCG-928-G15]|nr:hypothetical protein [Desulfovibrio sp. OttesenSCG-928-G15]